MTLHPDEQARELAQRIVNELNEKCVLVDLEGTHLGFDPDDGYLLVESIVAPILARVRQQALEEAAQACEADNTGAFRLAAALVAEGPGDARPNVQGASPVCLDCNKAGLRNCSHFDNCDGTWVYKPDAAAPSLHKEGDDDMPSAEWQRGFEVGKAGAAYGTTKCPLCGKSDNHTHTELVEKGLPMALALGSCAGLHHTAAVLGKMREEYEAAAVKAALHKEGAGGDEWDSAQQARLVAAHLSLGERDIAFLQGYLHRAFVAGTECRAGTERAQGDAVLREAAQAAVTKSDKSMRCWGCATMQIEPVGGPEHGPFPHDKDCFIEGLRAALAASPAGRAEQEPHK